jgi:apolipoprotein D and lipocalin family protein
MRRTALSALVAAMLAFGGQALAAAPQPKKSVDIPKFLGKWYEVAHTYNPRQKDCFVPTMEWVRKADKFSVIQACRKGSATGVPQSFTGAAKISDTKTNAKMDIAFFGGVVRQEYWVLDHADDYAWALVGTPGGNFVWLLTRKPSVSAAEKADLVAKAKALGYDTAKLIFAGA